MDTQCHACGRQGTKSNPVVVMVVWYKGLDKPVYLLPKDHYLVCKHIDQKDPCKSAYLFVDLAIASSPVTSKFIGQWSEATILTTKPNEIIHLYNVLRHGTLTLGVA